MGIPGTVFGLWSHVFYVAPGMCVFVLHLCCVLYEPPSMNPFYVFSTTLGSSVGGQQEFRIPNASGHMWIDYL